MTDFSRYLIISDLDGTFFDDEKRPAPRNLTALRRFHEGGGIFTLASGRVSFLVTPFIEEVDTLLNAPAALCNGACLYDFSANTAHMEDFIPPEDAEALLEFFQTHYPSAYLRVSTRERIYYDVLTTPFAASPVRFCDPSTYRIEADYRKWQRTHWYKVVVVLHSDEEAQGVRRALIDHFGDRLTLTTATAKTVEIQRGGVTKATGIEKLRRFSPQTAGRTVIACGDFENDIEMLRAADIAVCPANAHDAAKAVADYILCDHNDGVIADIIKAIESGELKQKRGQTV